MIIQDPLIAICSVGLAYALVPQVYYGFKYKKGTITYQTGLITWFGLWAIAICMMTLRLWFSGAINIVTGILWMILVIQRKLYGLKNENVCQTRRSR